MSRVALSALSWGDIDNDSDLDLVLSGTATFNNIAKVYINNGTSLVESSQWQNNLTAVNYGSLALGDIDNDGDLDLALSGCGAGADFVDACNNGAIQTKIYINNGTTFTENLIWQSNLTAVYRPGSLTFVDIDNDGNLDLALNGQTESTITSKIYINNGTTFTENLIWQSNLTALRKASLAFHDYDNDGDLDLIISGRDNSDNKLTKAYLNNGTSFVESSQWGNNLVNVEDSSLAFADFDNDGDLDLSLTGCCDLHRIYRNNGSTFTEMQREGQGLAGVFAGSQAFGDYDNDGDLDLIINGREEATVLYLYNVSSSNFTRGIYDQESHINDLYYGSLAWIDLDNDRDLDLIETGYGDSGLRVYVYISNASLTKNNTQPHASNSSFSSDYTNNVLTLGWGNGSDNETPTAGLYYNLMVGNSTTNHTVVSGVYGGSSNPTAGYFGNMMQRKNITLNLELEANETYYWYVQTIDTGLAKSAWSAAQNFTTGLDVNKPNITLNSPSPNASLHTTNASFVFNATVTDANLTNVTLYADFNGTMLANETNSSGLSGTYIFTKNLTDKNDGIYSWYIYVCDGDNNCQTSGTRSFYLDRAYPVVNSISPSNGASSSSASVTFSYNVTDTDIANCSLIISGGVVNTSTSVSEDESQSFTYSLSNGDYDWNVNCTDYVGYTNSSSNRSLTVSYTAPTNGGNGGGGGGSSTTIPTTVTPTPKEFDVDFSTASTGTIEAKQGDVKTFSFNSQITHKITATEITTNSVKLIIESEPITIILNINETKQIDINNDGINDFEIKLISIIKSIADLLLTKLEGADIVGQEEIEEAIRKEALFDVKVNIENLFQIVKSGREVIAQIEVFNVNNIGQVDVLVNYYIIDKENNTISEGSDTLAVEAVASFVRSLKVPYDVKSGIYYFNVDVKYQDMIMASGHTEFRVIRNYEIIIAVGIIALIIVGIFFYLWRIKKKGEKDVGGLKRKERKLERRINLLEGLKKLKRKKKKKRC